MTFGLIPLLDGTGLNPGVRQAIILSLYFAGVFLVIKLKRRVTHPRSGYVELSKKTTSRLSLILLIINVVIFLIFAGAYIFNIPLWDIFGSYRLSIPLGLIFLIMFAVSGGLIKSYRFHLYGVLVFISFVLFEHLFLNGHVADHGIPLAAFFSGGIIILSGFLHFIFFVKKYQLETE